MTTHLGAAGILRELYPSPHDIVVARPVPRGGFLALPGPQTARLLVPTSARAAAASLRHARRPFDVRSKVATALAHAALRSGGARLVAAGYAVNRVAGAESIETLLTSVLGRPIAVGIFLGPPRANRKPVLQVLDERGHLLAIAKIGLTPLTRALAVAEGAALTDLGARTHHVLTTPRLLHLGEWRGHTVLVQSALDLVGAPVEIDPATRHAAMREVAEANGVETRSWAGSPYVARLTERARALPEDELSQRVRAAIGRLTTTDVPVRFGTWHGDWTEWNMAVRDGRALVWDWERYERDVPVGFDALHYAFMVGKIAGESRSEAGVGLLARAEGTLAPLRIPNIEASTIAFAYLLDLATRYLADKRADAGVGRRGVAQWLMPALALHGGSILGVGNRHG